MKHFVLCTAVAVLLCGAFCASCSHSSSSDDTFAPTDTWVKRDYSYTSNDGTVSALTCYFLFSQNGYTNSSLKNVTSDSQNGSATSIKPGLTVVLVAADGATSGILGAADKKYFLMKTFTLGSQTVEDGDGSSSSISISMSYTKWNLIYLANLSEFAKSGYLSAPPAALTDSSYTDVATKTDEYATLLKSFSWKKLLIAYLLYQLENS